MSVSLSCLQGFEWEGIPSSQNGNLGNNDSYITRDNQNNTTMIVHDILDWKFTNIRLLADHYSREANVTVYVPDFFGGQSLPPGPIFSGNWHELDVDGFMSKNTRQLREPEDLDCTRDLRVQYKKVAAVGFCYEGRAVFCVLKL